MKLCFISFPKGDHNYYFEEFQLHGSAHLAVTTGSAKDTASFYFESMIGDRTGTLHIGADQTMDLFRPQIDLPFNVIVYDDGILGLANDTVVHGVTITLHGTLMYVENLTCSTTGEGST